MFKWLKDTPADTLTDVQRAARFYYLQHQCFGGRVETQNWGTDTHAPPVNLLRIEAQLSAAHLRLTNTYVERLHWRDCMQRYDRPYTFFYLDPPYWQTEGYGVPFPFSEYRAMAEAMRGLKGKALLSINDHPDIRTCSSGLDMEEVEIGYQVGGGAPAVRQELVVWDQATEPGFSDAATSRFMAEAGDQPVNRWRPLCKGCIVPSTPSTRSALGQDTGRPHFTPLMGAPIASGFL